MFKNEGLYIIIKCNLKIVNYSIPMSIEKHLSSLSSSKEIFEETTPYYE